jgi:hypothetical protein
MVKYGEKADVIQFDKRDLPTGAIKKAKDPYKGVRCDVEWLKIRDAYGKGGDEEVEKEELK